jgi:RND family efflux transporter MFP subunit
MTSMRLRLLSLAMLVVLPGCLPEATAEDVSGPDAPTVRIEVVGDTVGADVRRFVGRVEAASTVDLAFQLAGQVVELPLWQGEVAPAGTLIAALDEADFRLALARAEATLELTQAEHARARDLAARGAAPEARQDQALADLRLAEVEVEVARRDLELARMEAPFDALITRRLVDRYGYVEPGQAVMRVQDVSELRVRISVPEDLIGLARQPDAFVAGARVAAVPDFAAPLVLREFVSETDSVTQTYDVSFAIDAPRDERVLPGMTATVELRATGAGADAPLMVPVAAVDGNGSEGFQVWVFDRESGTVEPRAVSVGLPEGAHVPVLDGLAPGELIVAAGIQHLAPGLQVRALNL